MEVTTSEIIQGENVFVKVLSVEAGFRKSINSNSSFWKEAYFASEWFANVYRTHIIDQSFSLFNIFFKAIDYKVDLIIKMLWKHHKNLYLSCVSESKVLRILKQAHDEGEHWAKQGTLAKLRKLVYWSSQFTDVERYIQRYIKCAQHESALKSQFLHSIRVHDPFQLMRFDFIKSLSKIRAGCIYIFHVMDYFSRFSITFSFKIVNAEDVISCLNQVFDRYIRFLGIYCDREHHFQNIVVKDFLFEFEITLIFSSSGAFQSTDMIEVENKLFEDILRKSQSILNWE